MFCLKNATAKITILVGSLVIFFFISPASVFAATLSIGNIQPSSGSSIPNQATTFQTTFSDSDGYGNIAYVMLVFKSESVNPPQFVVYYDLQSNKFYVVNDQNTDWLGGYAPGTKVTIENSDGVLDCSKSFVSGSGNTLTVYWNISFKAKFVEAYKKNICLNVHDISNATTDWWVKGSWVVKNLGQFPPEIGAVTPVNGISKPNEAVNFTTTFADRDGWENLHYVSLLFSTDNYRNDVYAMFLLNSNLLTLSDSSEFYGPGSKNIIETPLLKLDCSKTTVSGSGNTLTINWNLIFKDQSADNKIREIIVSAKDKDNLESIRVRKGVWLIGENFPPQVDSIFSNSRGEGETTEPDLPVTFYSTFSDPNGGVDIKEAALMINTTVDGKNCFYAYYDSENNKFYLRNDAGTAWLGGFSPESNNTIENSFAILDCSKSRAPDYYFGTDKTIYWRITFKPVFSGTKNIYTFVKDTFGAYEDWKNKGVFKINYSPVITSFSPAHRAIFVIGAPLRISASVFDRDNDPLEFKYFLDGQIIAGWANLSEYFLPTGTKDRGRHNIKVDVKDVNDGSASSSADIFICRDFPKPPEN